MQWINFWTYCCRQWSRVLGIETYLKDSHLNDVAFIYVNRWGIHPFIAVFYSLFFVSYMRVDKRAIYCRSYSLFFVSDKRLDKKAIYCRSYCLFFVWRRVHREVDETWHRRISSCFFISFVRRLWYILKSDNKYASGAGAEIEISEAWRWIGCRGGRSVNHRWRLINRRII